MSTTQQAHHMDAASISNIQKTFAREEKEDANALKQAAKQLKYAEKSVKKSEKVWFSQILFDYSRAYALLSTGYR